MLQMIQLSIPALILLSFNTMANEIDFDKTSTETLLSQHNRQYHSLTDLEWNYRLILAKSDNTQDIVALFKKYAEAIDDRKIAWFVFNGNELHSNIIATISSSLRRELMNYLSRYSNNDMVLIGYDGEAKSVDNVFNIVNFFEEIDRMPIRQYEMKVNATH